jgi:hypothetical protein
MTSISVRSGVVTRTPSIVWTSRAPSLAWCRRSTSGMAAILRNPEGTVMSSFAGITSERSWSVSAVAWLNTP